MWGKTNMILKIFANWNSPRSFLPATLEVPMLANLRHCWPGNSDLVVREGLCDHNVLFFFFSRLYNQQNWDLGTSSRIYCGIVWQMYIDDVKSRKFLINHMGSFWHSRSSFSTGKCRRRNCSSHMWRSWRVSSRSSNAQAMAPKYRLKITCLEIPRFSMFGFDHPTCGYCFAIWRNVIKRIRGLSFCKSQSCWQMSDKWVTT